jgi:hypothetical protein
MRGINTTVSVIIISIILSFCCNIAIAEEKSSDIPRASIGVGGTFGYYNLKSTGTNEPGFDGGIGYGGGLVFEGMFNNTFGIHSGLWYGLSKIKLKMKEGDSGPSGDVFAETSFFYFPIYLITSFGSTSFSFNILTGLSYSYIRKCLITASGMEMDMSDYINYQQTGLSFGLNVKFAVAAFVDIFIGGITDYYITSFSRNFGDDSRSNFYDFRVIVGVMFRTYK